MGFTEKPPDGLITPAKTYMSLREFTRNDIKLLQNESLEELFLWRQKLRASVPFKAHLIAS
jgi:hypothetical protein